MIRIRLLLDFIAMVVHFHGHGRYSLLEGIGDIGSIAKQAAGLGMKSIGLTDYNGMYGAMEFVNKCKKSEINPIIGVELPLVYDVSIKKTSENLGYITLIALHFEGYQNLLKIASIAQTTAFFNGPRIDLATIKNHGTGVMILWGGGRSVVTTMLKNGESTSKIADLVEISLGCVEQVIGEIAVQSPHIEKRTTEHNKFLFETSKELGFELVAGCNYHYIKSTDKLTYEVALCAKDQLQFSNPARRKVLGDFHIMSDKETMDGLRSHGYSQPIIDQLILRGETIAESITIKLPTPENYFPVYQVPEHISALYQQMESRLVEE